ncbi:hypothetical protein [Sellimonas intestinalis]|uniref:Uncharacterized protein n=1 Tax=virus sp. ctah610 TaxID=2826807 RepID=A0A8S5R7M9_9VIRU|nr:hypothetical protein [Sellimonas intestinalis]DAE27097.1 MAG TPA: hypothetical protein [virus sp. ctah610]
MMLIKARYIKADKPSGREYTFKSNEMVKPGDAIMIGKAQAVVTDVNVPEEEVLPFRDKLKEIDGKVED